LIPAIAVTTAKSVVAVLQIGQSLIKLDSATFSAGKNERPQGVHHLIRLTHEVPIRLTNWIGKTGGTYSIPTSQHLREGFGQSTVEGFSFLKRNRLCLTPSARFVVSKG
jgi:hypothetical protein